MAVLASPPLRTALLCAALSCAPAVGCGDEGGVPGSFGEGGGGEDAATGPGGPGVTASSGGPSAVGSGGFGGGDIPGSWGAPFEVTSYPYVHEADSTQAPASAAQVYTPCAPGTDESGGEHVYRLVIDEPGWLEITLMTGAGVDVDAHLLALPSPDACVARADVELGHPVAPGVWWLAVDTWVDGQGQVRAGPYTLIVDVVTEGDGACLERPVACEDDTYPLVNGIPPFEQPGEGGCPDGMVRVEGAPAFCIDRYEAMVAAVLDDGDLASFSPYEHPTGQRLIALSVAGVVPQGYISQLQADDACAEAGKRLCDDDEWLRACRGASDHDYPYGDAYVDDACNADRTCHPVVQYFETGASWIWSELAHPCMNQLPEGLMPTGYHDACQSEAGAMDMVGNLHEWTSDPAGTFRGGFYVDTVVNGEGCAYRTVAHNVQHWDYSTGFRCCADL